MTTEEKSPLELKEALNAAFGRIQRKDHEIWRLSETQREHRQLIAKLERQARIQNEVTSDALLEKSAYMKASETVYFISDSLRRSLEGVMKAQNLEGAQSIAQQAIRIHDLLLGETQRMRIQVLQEALLSQLSTSPNLSDEERKLLDRFFADHGSALLTPTITDVELPPGVTITVTDADMCSKVSEVGTIAEALRVVRRIRDEGNRPLVLHEGEADDSE